MGLPGNLEQNDFEKLSIQSFHKHHDQDVKTMIKSRKKTALQVQQSGPTHQTGFVKK